ncbi:hypothetical protein G7Y89_g5361 [Cudoniella acicularis]|uniref:Uncharacterized protein n=1 Tax=Cudoniella acicularis TaxID=354080 RepID=A0A8H4W5S7_9HELO|nr:hypothetical protein G7Y89_g5361 [Cudoniella acicularis]
MVHSPVGTQSMANPSNSERTVLALCDRLEATATFQVTPTTTITITTRTSQGTACGPVFVITLNPESELNTICSSTPPNPSHLALVEEYILYTTSCALASHFSSLSKQDGGETDKSAPGKDGWYATAQPTVLRKMFKGGKGKQLIFDANRLEDGTGCRLTVAWDWMRHENFGDDPSRAHTEKDTKITGEGSHEWLDKGKSADGMWDDGEGEVVRTLGDMVETAGKWVGSLR